MRLQVCRRCVFVVAEVELKGHSNFLGVEPDGGEEPPLSEVM